MPPKNAKSPHDSLSRQNSVKFCKDFMRHRIFSTWTLFARLYVFCISGSAVQCSAVKFSVVQCSAVKYSAVPSSKIHHKFENILRNACLSCIISRLQTEEELLGSWAFIAPIMLQSVFVHNQIQFLVCNLTLNFKKHLVLSLQMALLAGLKRKMNKILLISHEHSWSIKMIGLVCSLKNKTLMCI